MFCSREQGRMWEVLAAGEEELAQEILAKCEVDVNMQKPGSGSTLLHGACYMDMKGMMSDLHAKGAQVSIRNDGGAPPLHSCMQCKNGKPGDCLENVQMLLDWGADANAYNKVKGINALMWANHFGSCDISDALISAGASISAENGKGQKPHEIESECQNAMQEYWDEKVRRETVEYCRDKDLLNEYTVVNFNKIITSCTNTQDGSNLIELTPEVMTHAIRNLNKSSIELLIEAGLGFGRDDLLMLAREGTDDMVQLAIQLGADFKGIGALIEAASAGNCIVVP